MKNKSLLIFYSIAFAIAILITIFTLNISAPNDADIQYFCDYKHMTLDMEVDVKNMDGNKLFNINGEVFAGFEDDLAMTNSDKQVVRHTNDIYNFITQNEHVIYSDNDELLYKCDGKIKIFADSYDVFNADGDKIAYVSFNMFDTCGIMKNMDGEIIARYDSALSRKDYFVSIYDECEIDDESILMIFASYVSDKRSDDSN